jgi:hypothetical protein
MNEEYSKELVPKLSHVNSTGVSVSQLNDQEGQMIGMVRDTKLWKEIFSESINLRFRKRDGYTEMFGENEDTHSPIGPFIADIEITTSCLGVPDKNGIKRGCDFCYKSNNPNGTYMNLETYKKVLGNLNQNNTITQVALGVDSEASQNPDLESILKHTRNIGIIPNITIANITEETGKMLMKYIGAAAVSRYQNKECCYDTIKLLSDLGLKQVNMHFCIHSRNYDDLMETLSDIKTDPRLAGLNAIVLLSLKQKGRGVSFKPLDFDKFYNVYEYMIKNGLNFGFDSCTANKCIIAAKKYGNYEEIKDYVEACESSAFSLYSSVKGKFYPCSFIENAIGWEDGLDLTDVSVNFLKDVWFHPKTVEFREKLLCDRDCNNCRQCPVYNI